MNSIFESFYDYLYVHVEYTLHNLHVQKSIPKDDVTCDKHVKKKINCLFYACTIIPPLNQMRNHVVQT